MQKRFKCAVWAWMAVFAISMACASGWAADMVTVIGTVNDEGAIVSEEGSIYELGDDEKSDELVERVGAKVEVKGSVTIHEDGSQTITLENYTVLEE